MRTCHASWFKPSTLNRTPLRGGVYLLRYYPYPELLYVLQDIHTRTRNLCKFCTPTPRKYRELLKFCKTLVPVPELLEVLLDIHTRTRKLCEFCTPRATIPGVWVKHLLYPPGTSVSSVRPCHNTWNFWKFCKTPIPLSGIHNSSRT